VTTKTPRFYRPEPVRSMQRNGGKQAVSECNQNIAADQTTARPAPTPGFRAGIRRRRAMHLPVPAKADQRADANHTAKSRARSPPRAPRAAATALTWDRTRESHIERASPMRALMQSTAAAGISPPPAQRGGIRGSHALGRNDGLQVSGSGGRACSQNVTGPSFIRCSFMSAPKRPAATGACMPRALCTN